MILIGNRYVPKLVLYIICSVSLLFFGLVSIGLVVASGLSGQNQLLAQTVGPTITVALVDRSGSPSEEPIRKRYVHDFEKIYDSLRGGDRILLDSITYSSKATSSWPVDTTIPVRESDETDRSYSARLTSARSATFATAI